MSWLYLSGTMESRPPGWTGTVSALQTAQRLNPSRGGPSLVICSVADDGVSRAMMSSLSLFEVTSVFDLVRCPEICRTRFSARKVPHFGNVRDLEKVVKEQGGWKLRDHVVSRSAQLLK